MIKKKSEIFRNKQNKCTKSIIYSKKYIVTRVNVTDQLINDICKKYINFLGFVNDYSHCPAYYSCVNFLAFNVDCPDPFYFKTTGSGDGFCQWPDAITCERCPAGIGIYTVSYIFNFKGLDICSKKIYTEKMVQICSTVLWA